MTAPRDADGGRSLVADDVTVRGSLRVVDEAGRSLVFIGRESVEAGSQGADQAVIGLFAGAGSDAPQQTIRIATSAAGSALSIGTQDGAASVSIFAGENAVSVDLRKGDTTHTLSERWRSVGCATANLAIGVRGSSPPRSCPTPVRRHVSAPYAAPSRSTLPSHHRHSPAATRREAPSSISPTDGAPT